MAFTGLDGFGLIHAEMRCGADEMVDVHGGCTDLGCIRTDGADGPVLHVPVLHVHSTSTVPYRRCSTTTEAPVNQPLNVPSSASPRPAAGCVPVTRAPSLPTVPTYMHVHIAWH